jgi:hypothetical protein
MDALNGVLASLYWIDHSRLMKMDIFISFFVVDIDSFPFIMHGSFASLFC